MDFDRKRCLDLMAESNKLLQEGKCLYELDKVKSQKLSQYITLLCDEIFWKSRDQYLQIIESFLSGNIDIDTFINKFDDLQWSNIHASEKLQKNLENEVDFQPNLKSRGFRKIIAFVDESIELFDPEVTLDMNLKNPDLLVYGISEEFLKLDLKNTYLPIIRQYCKKS